MKIYAMSRKKSDIAAYIEEGTQEIILHLIKLYMYPESNNVHHWRREVANFLNNVPRMKGSNKYPSAQFILKNSWSVNADKFEVWYNIVRDDYGPSKYDINTFILKETVYS